MWTDESWVSLCKRLLQNPRVELIFPGTASERPRAERVAKALGNAERIHNIAGQTSLRQLLTVLRRADLVISVDSGIMHLAAWMGVPVVGLFGPETPRLYAPMSSNPATPAQVISAALPCSPCLSVAADKITRCRDNQCMKLISADRVFLACRFALKPRDAEAA
jgi:ADP-heptose:LPS heptosyltransferase